MNGGSHHTSAAGGGVSGGTLTYDNLQDIEVVSESPPSLGINDELGLLTEELEDGMSKQKLYIYIVNT